MARHRLNPEAQSKLFIFLDFPLPNAAGAPDID
jgi:hypothetical protein